MPILSGALSAAATQVAMSMHKKAPATDTIILCLSAGPWKHWKTRRGRLGNAGNGIFLYVEGGPDREVPEVGRNHMKPLVLIYFKI